MLFPRVPNCVFFCIKLVRSVKTNISSLKFLVKNPQILRARLLHELRTMLHVSLVSSSSDLLSKVAPELVFKNTGSILLHTLPSSALKSFFCLQNNLQIKIQGPS